MGRKIRSPDGTEIGWDTGGDGPDLLLVHGAGVDRTIAWALVRAGLERRFTVHAMDRRGRGLSGDGPDYGLRREAEDVIAVLDALGGPVDVLGHSYGGLCAFEAARLTSRIRRLVLYEGVPIRGGDGYEPGIVARLEALLDAGRTDEMLVTMMRKVIRRSESEIAQLRAHRPEWERRIEYAHTIPRELRTEQEYVFRAERFRNLRTPTVFLVGGASPPIELDNARGVAGALADARVVMLDGQGHAAMRTAPEAFVQTVCSVLAA
jgi:pimeloyl-ACP methyl ester carboxylesterase